MCFSAVGIQLSSAGANKNKDEIENKNPVSASKSKTTSGNQAFIGQCPRPTPQLCDILGRDAKFSPDIFYQGIYSCLTKCKL